MSSNCSTDTLVNMDIEDLSVVIAFILLYDETRFGAMCCSAADESQAQVLANIDVRAHREAVMSQTQSATMCRFACSDRVHLCPSQSVYHFAFKMTSAASHLANK